MSRWLQIGDGLLIGIAWLIRIWFLVLVVQFVRWLISEYPNPL